MTDEKELKDLIFSKGLKLKYVAKYLGLSPYGLSLKMKNKNEFKTSEVIALCQLLDITSAEEKVKIFFAEKVDYKSTNND